VTDDDGFLVFTELGYKAYARTPGGEFVYSDSQGLYEWRRVPYAGPQTPGLPMETHLVRIQYSGGDRQGSSNGEMWISGPEAPGRDPMTRPHALGFIAAMDIRRMN
jgi:hypothetical protein